jgi:hypothetical protein
MHRRALLLGLALALGLTVPSTADALTTVSASQEPCEQVSRGVVECIARVAAVGDDGPSDVAARVEGERVLILRDAFGVSAGPGCEVVEGSGGTEARCVFTQQVSVRAKVTAGGGDDRVIAPFASIDGGPGDDVIQGSGDLSGGSGDDEIRGGDGRDTIDGGPGLDRIEGDDGDDLIDGGPGTDADLIDGGDGEDIVDYRRRTAPVRVALGTDEPDGEAGEDDRLVSIEGVVGGAGDDEMLGSEADDLLIGGPGDDVLRGAGGDDRLIDREGDNLLDGGPGDDVLTTGRVFGFLPSGVEPRSDPDSRSVLLGGDGDDSLTSGLGSDRLDPGRGRDDVSASGGRDRVWLRDGAADAVACGRYARARVDSRDLTQGCRNIERTGTARPQLLRVGGIIFEEFDGSEGIADIGCSDDQRAGCRGLIRVFALGREVGRARIDVRPGRSEEIRFALDPRLYDVVRDDCSNVRGVYRLDTRDARGRTLVTRGRQTFYSAGVSSPCG